MTLSGNGDEIVLTVEDDGVGWSGEGTVTGTGLGGKIIMAMAKTLGSPILFDSFAQGHAACLRFAAAEPLAFLIQILLPTADNEGATFSDADFRKVSDELTERFGGLTAFTRSPAEGRWTGGPLQARQHRGVRGDGRRAGRVVVGITGRCSNAVSGRT